ncbi:MAG: hypothetical protein AB8H12_15195 [Lewinella sp.]
MLLTLALLASTCTTNNKPVNGNAATGTAERPNIVLIVADDMGWVAPAYMGNTLYHTPNLDRLSKSCQSIKQALWALPPRADHLLEVESSAFNIRIADKVWSYTHSDFRV